jgi:hypothetical protein
MYLRGKCSLESDDSVRSRRDGDFSDCTLGIWPPGFFAGHL